MRLRDRSLSEYMPLLDHATPRIVLLKDGSALAMFEVDGLPVQTLGIEAVYRARRTLNHSLCGQISTDGLVLYNWVTRGFAPESVYPQGTFRSTFSQGLDQRYKARLFDRFLYLNKTYVGVMLRPARLAGEWVGDQTVKLQAPRDTTDEPPIERIRRLIRICDIIEGDLESYNPRPLGWREDDQGRVFSEVAEALIFAMTGTWRSVGVQAGRRIGTMFSERIIFGYETVEIRGPGYSTWAACFGAKDMPHRCPPGTLDGFLSAPFRSTIAQSWRVIGTQPALTLMGRQQNRMTSAGDRAISQIRSLDLAMDEVQSGRMAMGDYSMVATVFTDDLPSMREVAKDAWHTLQEAGCQVAREDAALEAAYFSMLPGNARLRPRVGAVSSWNFASLAAMHAFPAGEDRGHWGGPVALFRTTGGTPFRYHLHTTTGVANCFVFGETGSGKSVFLCFLAAQAERLGIQIVFWDKDRGGQIMTQAVGGRYLSIRNPTGLAPLKAYQSTPDDIRTLSRLIRAAINTPTPHEWTPEEDRRLFLGLNAIMALPPADRWMADLRAFLGASRTGAGAKLEKWCRGNEYGFVMDNVRDMVKLDASVLGFDVTEFLNDPMVCGPVVTDLLYRTSKLADGRRILYIVDEAWKVVNIPAFAESAMDHLKVDRKKNAAMILGSQSIRDALDSPIGYTIREQAKTVVAFGVERPDRADFNALRYTDRECDIIESLKLGTGMFLLRQNGRSVVCQLPLKGLADDLAVLSGNEINVHAMDRVVARYGDDVTPETLIEAFHQERALT